MMASCKIKKLQNLCRTCMGEQHSKVIATSSSQKAESLISIYHEHETKDFGNIKIVELLKQTAPQITVETNDMLPKTICESCLDVLVNVHEFQLNALRVEQRLRDIVKENNSSHEVEVGTLNNNMQDEGGKNLKVETDEPLIDVAAPVKGLFSLLQKDGEIIEVYNELEKCNGKTNGWSQKCGTDDELDRKGKPEFDTDASKARNNENDNQSDVTLWKYIEMDYRGSDPVKKEESSKKDIHDNGEVNDWPHRPKRKSKRLGIRTRTFRKLNSEFEKAKVIADESNNRQQTIDAVEDVDSELRLLPRLAKCKDIQEVAEVDSLESDCNGFSGDDGSEWEIPLDKFKMFKCKSINNDSKLEGNLQDNLKVKNQDDKTVVSVKLDTSGFYCSKCGKCFKTRANLKMHLKGHLRKEQKQHSTGNGYICPECGKRLKTRVTFRRHLVVHETDETKMKYKCQYCNKVFSQSCALRYHARMHTGERPYLCSICGKSFATQCSLKQHYRRHGTESNYQCPHCPKRFRCSSSMSTHKAIVHTILRPHVCDICGASFKKPYSLTKHKINHGEKKHKCDYCEMKFARPDQCRRHMRTHTGEKPYKCRYCERAYAQSNDMIKHLRVHIGDNVYRCEMCPQAFRLLCELRAHFATHKDDDEQTKFQNLKALKEEETRIQAKIESVQVTEQQS